MVLWKKFRNILHCATFGAFALLGAGSAFAATTYTVTLTLNGGSVPYEQAPYLYSSGTRYINTGLTANSKSSTNLCAVAEFKPSNLSPVSGSYSTIFGQNGQFQAAYTSSGAAAIGNATSGLTFYSTSQTASVAGTLNQTTAGGYYVNNNETGLSRTFHGDAEICLLAASSSGIYPARGYLYSFYVKSGVYDSRDGKCVGAQVGETPVLLMNLVPARYSGTLGMYDTVSGSFFTGSGSGSFATNTGGIKAFPSSYIAGIGTKLFNPTKTGYTFSGWTGSNGTTPQKDLTISSTATGNKSYTANWTANTYTITYVPGDGATGTNQTQTVTYQGKFTTKPANTFQKSNAMFAGWVSVEASSGYSAASTEYTYTNPQNLTLKATWTCNDGYVLNTSTNACDGTLYTITYDCGTGATGGSTPPSQSVSYGGTYTPRSNTCTKTGYHFSGWYVSNTGADTRDPSQSYTWAYEENKTFIANWAVDTYSITLNDSTNGGSGGTGTIKEVYNTKWTNSSGTTITSVTVPTKANANFLGYYASASSTAIQYIPSNGSLSNLSKITFTAGTTIYAHFECKAGYTLNSSTKACDPCANGKYKTSAGNGACSSCPAAETSSGYSYVSGTGWTSLSSCKETKPASSVSSYCYSGALTKTASSASAWGTASSSLTAKQGSILTGSGNSTSCAQCTGATYMASANGHTNTTCTSCPTQTSGWTRGSGTGWTSYSSCYETQTPAGCSAGSVKHTASSASAWNSNVTLVTTLTAANGYYASSTATSCTACPSLPTGYDFVSGTGWTSYSQCQATKSYSSISTTCASGALTKTASSASAWGTAVSTLTAKANSYITGTGDSTRCTACGSSYPSSAGGNIGSGSCYRSCTTNDVTESAAVSGVYYASGTNTCAATSCNVNRYLSSGSCPACTSIANTTQTRSGSETCSISYAYAASRSYTDTCNGTMTTSAGGTNGSSSCSGCSSWQRTSTGTCYVTSCKAGYRKGVSSNATSCVACETGKYSSDGNTGTTCSNSCSNKPANSSYTAGAASNSCPWACDSTYYKSGSSCVKVGAGKYSPSYDNDVYSCTNKPDNSSYTGGAASNSCPWACNAGYTLNSAGTGCVACNDGEYKTSVGNDACNTCISLQKGYSHSDNGKDAATDCYLNTSSGKYVAAPNDAETSCAEDGYCPGSVKVYYGSAGGRTACTSPYSKAAAGSTSANSCYLVTSAGSYVVSTGDGQTTCAKGGYCLGGTTVYKSGSGHSTTGGYTSCGVGTYNANTGSSSSSACVGASDGYYVDSYGASTQTQCPTGYRDGSNNGRDSISDCYKSCTKTCSGNNTSQCPSNASCTYNTSSYTSGTQYYGGSCSASSSLCPLNSFTCGAGWYADGSACYDPGNGYYSPSGDNNRYSCATQVGSTYTSSDGSRASASDCYRSCTQTCTGQVDCPSHWNCSYDTSAYTSGTQHYGAACTAAVSTCQINSHTCDYGYYYTSSACTSCTTISNTTQTRSGNESCTVANAYATTRTYTDTCNGTYNGGAGGTNGSSYCSGCSSWSRTSTGTCYVTSCKAGYRKGASSNATSCVACETGKYSSDGNTGTTCSNSCSNKPANSSYTAGAASNSCPWACNAGYTLNSAGTGCVACANGTYKTSAGNGACSSCPAAETSSGYSYVSGTGWTSLSDCKETKPASSVSSYCYSGALTKTATGANAWGTASSSLTAKQGSILTGSGNSTSCAQCTGATYMASANGHTNTTCTSCPTQTSGWTRGTGTGWTSYSSCYETQTPSCASAGSVKHTASSASTWGSSLTLVTALTAKAGYYASSTATSCTQCPSGYPNSAAGSDEITDCYSNSKSRSWTGSQVNGTTPTGCTVTEWSSCTRNACSYVAYSNSAGTGDGTIKSGCSTNSENCPKPVRTVSANNGYYAASGATTCTACPSLPSGYDFVSGTGWTSYSQCQATKSYTSVSSNCASGELTKTAKNASEWNTAVSTLTAKANSYITGTGDSTRCTACGSSYPSSAGGDIGSGSCYRSCTKGDITGSSAVSGIYYASGDNTCAATACNANRYLSSGSCPACPSGYPNSAAGSDEITSCYSNSKSRAWTGSQTPCTNPDTTGCNNFTCNSCSKNACSYVAYSNSAGTGDGTVKSGCETNNAACQQTVKSLSAKSNYYVDGTDSCPACNVSFTDSGSDSCTITNASAASKSYTRTCYHKTSVGGNIDSSSCTGTQSCGTKTYGTCYVTTCKTGYSKNTTTNATSCVANTYTITLNDSTNGGSGGTGTIKEVYNTKWTNSSGSEISSVTIPTKSKAVFTGYYGSSNSTALQYIPASGSLSSLSKTTFTEGKTIYAQFASCTCTKGTGVNSCDAKTVSNNKCTYDVTYELGYYGPATQTNSNAGTGAYEATATPCPTAYPYTDSTGTDKIGKCYLVLTAGQKVASAGAGAADCSAGRYCTSTSKIYYNSDGGTTTYTGTQCTAGSYSTAGSSSCTACGNGKTSTAGATSSSSCTNCGSISGSAGWADTSWNNNNTMTNLCTISGCKATYYKSGNSCPACPTGYPNSAAGSDEITDCYSNSKSRAWTGSQTPCTNPDTTGCNNFTCNSCSKNACSYVAYSNSAGTGDGTVKSGCETNNAACQQTVKSLSAKSNYYVDGTDSCPACNVSFTDSGSDSCTITNASAASKSYTRTCYHKTSVGGNIDSSSCTGTQSCGTKTYGTCYVTTCKTGYSKNTTTNATSCVANTYTITYKAGTGGNGSDVTQSVTFNAKFTTKAATTFTKSHATFAGWESSDSPGYPNASTEYTYNNTIGVTLTATWSCNAGYTLNSSTGNCDACSAGTYKGTSGNEACTPCSSGYYSSGTGNTSCTACATGAYSTGTGNTSCTACAAGKINTGTANTSCTTSCSSIANRKTWKTPQWNNADNTVSDLCQVATCNACSNGTGAENCSYSISDNSCVYSATCKMGYNTPVANSNSVSCSANQINIVWDGVTSQSSLAENVRVVFYDGDINTPKDSNIANKTGISFVGWKFKK